MNPLTTRQQLSPLAATPEMRKLAEKMKFGSGLKQVITNQFNFTDIENPFLNSDMTLQNLKKERHQRWLEKKEARRETIKTQMKDL
jgi:hypothetical protein